LDKLFYENFSIHTPAILVIVITCRTKKILTPDVITLFNLQSANAVTVSLHYLLNILSSSFIFAGKGKCCFLKCVYNEKSGKHLLAAISVERCDSPVLLLDITQ